MVWILLKLIEGLLIQEQLLKKKKDYDKADCLRSELWEKHGLEPTADVRVGM